MTGDSAAGHTCVAPAWRDHAGEPAALRANPPATLGDLTLEEVISAMELEVRNAAQGNDLPIVIGHSVGGLVTQLMIAVAGVPISSVAPNRMLTLDWPFFKNVTTIVNPLKGDKPQLQTVESFHASFCNTLDNAQAAVAFETTATHDSGNVLRRCLGSAGHIDLDQAHAPMLFISGSEDRIVPAHL
ncbi:MAG TPA: alpha/beta fold hydrolase, partial [Kofleriaceae bacterium]